MSNPDPLLGYPWVWRNGARYAPSLRLALDWMEARNFLWVQWQRNMCALLGVTLPTTHTLATVDIVQQALRGDRSQALEYGALVEALPHLPRPTLYTLHIVIEGPNWGKTEQLAEFDLDPCSHTAQQAWYERRGV